MPTAISSVRYMETLNLLVAVKKLLGIFKKCNSSLLGTTNYDKTGCVMRKWLIFMQLLKNFTKRNYYATFAYLREFSAITCRDKNFSHTNIPFRYKIEKNIFGFLPRASIYPWIMSKYNISNHERRKTKPLQNQYLSRVSNNFFFSFGECVNI